MKVFNKKWQLLKRPGIAGMNQLQLFAALATDRKLGVLLEDMFISDVQFLFVNSDVIVDPTFDAGDAALAECAVQVTGAQTIGAAASAAGCPAGLPVRHHRAAQARHRCAASRAALAGAPSS